MSWFILGWLTALVLLCACAARWLLKALKLADDAWYRAQDLESQANLNRKLTAEVLGAARKSRLDAYAPLSLGDASEHVATDDTVCSVCTHKLGFHKSHCHYPSCHCQVSVDREPKEILS